MEIVLRTLAPSPPPQMAVPRTLTIDPARPADAQRAERAPADGGLLQAAGYRATTVYRDADRGGRHARADHRLDYRVPAVGDGANLVITGAFGEAG